LGLTGHALGATEAIALGLADYCLDSTRLHDAWDALSLASVSQSDPSPWIKKFAIKPPASPELELTRINHFFGLPSAQAIVQALEADSSEWAQKTASTLRHRSPMMLEVVLQQIRRARTMTLAEDLRMERDMVRHCFYTAHLNRSVSTSETVEGIRALAVDKDHSPRWNPQRVEDVSTEMVAPFFESPWPAHAHPLRDL
jgi:enoyl-CoA hydratase